MTMTSSAITPAPQSAPRVCVENLSVCLTKSNTPIVDDVSFQLGRGQVLGLVGESGSGKTTAGLALMGYTRRGLRISGGSVHVGGRDILQLDAAELQQVRGRVVAYVPQDPASALNPAMKVGAQLREVFTAHPDCLPGGASVQATVLKVLEAVRLPDPRRVLDSYPHQLSGGQQQRVGIAMAFAADPELIIFDEPTTGLDVTTQRHFLDTVRRLAVETGVAAVYVSHDLPVVAEIADQTAVMHQGRIIECGPTRALFERPQQPYTAALVKAIPSVEKRAEPFGAPADGAHPQPVSAGEHTAGDVALSSQGLTARYGSRTVLRGVDFTLHTGTCLAVVGESGSGKTTFARSLIGLHDNWSGTVQFDGELVAERSAKRTEAQRRAMQYIFQSPYNSLNPRKTVGEILEAPLKLFCDFNRNDRLKRIDDTLSAVSLGPSFLNKFPHQLSGGQRQRVSLGRALVVEPTLMICDEITSALDVSVQAAILEELRALQLQRNLSLLFITHDLGVVRSIAQEVMVLDGGVIVECGSTDTVLDSPSHPYTQRLLADIPTMRASA
jgi:peptide/nickel transport system ATP-binding protein